MPDPIDWHCHLLPGLDDGPAEPKESLEMLGRLAEAGYRQVHCTPHLIRGLYDTTPDQVRRDVDILTEAAARQGLPVRLLPGMEYCLDEFIGEQLADPVPLGESGMLLAEVPSHAGSETVLSGVAAILDKGLTPTIAHPERCPVFFSRNPELADAGSLEGKLLSLSSLPPLLHALIEKGCRFQANLGSFAGLYGPAVRRQAETFLQLGLYSLLGTDGHGSRSLGRILKDPGLRESILQRMPDPRSLAV